MEGNGLQLIKNFSISDNLAQLIIQTVVAEAAERNTPVSVAVMDFGGHLVGFRRMDNAYFASAEAAVGKGRSCAGFQQSTGTFSEMAKTESWVGNLPGLIPLGGTCPLTVNGQFVGAVSVSGDTEESEQYLAEKAGERFPFLLEHFLRDDAPIGIEHVGITVPDMDAAERFFQQAFHAVTLYALIDKEQVPSGGEEITAMNGLRPDTAMKEVRMLRLGNGANVELFSLTGYQRERAAGMNDVGLTHLGVYCADIEAATRQFVAAGGELLAGPNPLSGCEGGEGNRFHFGKTPWGMLVEFIRFPSPLTYNKNGTVARWQPRA